MNGELVVDEYGDKRWYLYDNLHREDGPAIELADGDKEWWLNGEEVTESDIMKV